MKHDRPGYSPAAMIAFYEEALDALGAVCERTWHDRLQVLAEGRAARIWKPDATSHEVELQFVSPESGGARNADAEVFPGCPLTFALADALAPRPVPIQRVYLAGIDTRAPAPDVGARLWRAQFPSRPPAECRGTPMFTHHFSVLFLARCEIRAIDQHWSLHRLAVSLVDGSPDEPLASGFDLLGVAEASVAPDWPAFEPQSWFAWMRTALEVALGPEVAGIRVRQQRYLERELTRVDDYFEHYQQELELRSGRRQSGEGRLRLEQRLAAAKAEHRRRRDDQIARHAIRIVPHLDALLVVAEPAWRIPLETVEKPRGQRLEALFLGRSRRWVVPQVGG